MNCRIIRNLGFILALAFASQAFTSPAVTRNQTDAADEASDLSLSNNAATADSPSATVVMTPSPTPARVGAVTDADLNGLSVQDQILKLQAATQDQSAELDKLRQALADMKYPADNTGISNYNLPTMWNRLHFHANMDIIYGNQYDKFPGNVANGENNVLNATGSAPQYAVPDFPDGESGAFFKHVDLHFNYVVDENIKIELHYNLSALELDGEGINFEHIPLIPFTSGWLPIEYNLFVGLKRQYFGIEQQEDSEDTIFPYRALIFGGSNPFGHSMVKTQDVFEFNDQTTWARHDLVPELVYDKTLGLHFFHEKDLGPLIYDIGIDIVNDESEESFDGVGTDSLDTGFPFKAAGSQDWAEIGRLGLEPTFINRLLPWDMTFKGGFSAFHDPENGMSTSGDGNVYLTSQSIDEYWSNTDGADWRFDMTRHILAVTGEWVKREQYGPSYNNTSPGTYTAVNVYGGLQGSAEGWYNTVSIQPWRLFDPTAPMVELLCRYEAFRYENLSPFLQNALTDYTGTYNACTVGIKYTYKGNCHTSVDYTSYGLNGNFTSTGPTQLFQIEQQANF